ncbi:protein neprosin-like [Curcuma longa]|uniref:protein neprosin-like n=1 Tax=Curcuma longa TaxID=136217 RepID=UPI003D9E6BC9
MAFRVTEKRMLLLTFLFLCFAAQVMARESKTLLEKELLAEEKLKLINKPAVKTIQSADGDVIDCVDIYKQPAFDHPLLKNHIIKMKPTDDHSRRRDKGSSQATTSTGPTLSQTWQKSGACPNGTVPILRVQHHHLFNAPSIENYGRKPWNGVVKHELHLSNRTIAAGIEGLHANGVLIGNGYNYIGAKASIGIFNPWIEGEDEFTTGQIWLRNGRFNNSESIELGWMVNPSVFGDKTVRFFVYWTTDSGKETGCFNVICPGFVQTSSEIALGATFSQVSTFSGPQYEFLLEVWKDSDNERWWVVYGDTPVGYYPTTLFEGLSRSATLALFGGDVYSPRIWDSPHPTTGMGSGTFASYHFQYAAFIRQPRIKDFSGYYKYPYPYITHSNQVNCYSAENFAETLWIEPLFYYGGPGRNYPFCL